MIAFCFYPVFFLSSLSMSLYTKVLFSKDCIYFSLFVLNNSSIFSLCHMLYILSIYQPFYYKMVNRIDQLHVSIAWNLIQSRALMYLDKRLQTQQSIPARYNHCLSLDIIVWNMWEDGFKWRQTDDALYLFHFIFSPQSSGGHFFPPEQYVTLR